MTCDLVSIMRDFSRTRASRTIRGSRWSPMVAGSYLSSLRTALSSWMPCTTMHMSAVVSISDSAAFTHALCRAGSDFLSGSASFSITAMILRFSMLCLPDGVHELSVQRTSGAAELLLPHRKVSGHADLSELLEVVHHHIQKVVYRVPLSSPDYRRIIQ